MRALALLEEALARPEGQRVAWLAEQEDVPAEERDMALQMLGSLDEAQAMLATGGPIAAMSEGDAPERIGAYRIIDRIGQGGMGTVFRAKRDTGDFDHQVAIKLIRPGVLSEPLIARFERERQILASLSHPSIARLYDGGTSTDGGPFIVMEYIEGEPIDRWAQTRRLSREARVRLMIRVCEAVGFAHQNLIIHRDLTPFNVLVTPEGEPKLIDFGIARPLEQERAPEAAGDASVGRLSLTPGFAAPERYTGAPATTLTDIYSLGKLLEAVLEDGRDDADLAAIIARAAAPDPADRYTSAGVMARDMERYLATEPVEARAGGGFYVLGKFLRRQTFAVAAVATIVVLLIAGLTAATIGFREARLAQAQAEQRFGEVRSLAKTLLFDVYDEVNAVPGSTKARETLAATAQTYLDTLSRDPQAPFDVRLEAGQGYARLADVMGGVGGGNLGQREEALANYERADAILTALHEEAPANQKVALALADLRYARSNTMVHLTDDYERGVEFARSIEPILKRGCPRGDPCTLARAKASLAEGQSQYWAENFEAALAAFDRAIALLDGLGNSAKREAESTRLAAQAYRLKGDARYYLGDAPGSIEDYDVAVELLETGIARGLDTPDMARDLAIVQWTRGGSLDEVGRVAEAIAALEQSSAIMQRQVDADPEDAGSLRLLAVMEGQRGLTLSSAGRMREAIAAASESLAIRRSLSRLQPDQHGFYRDVAIQLNGLGEIHQRAGQRAEACRWFRETIAQFDRLDQRWGMSDFDRNDTYARAVKGAQGC
jgi:serine/threonine-protein kinase